MKAARLRNEVINLNRAERRRQARQEKKAKTKTYNFTEEQFQKAVQETFDEKYEQVKQEATDTAINTALILLLTLPLEVLMNYYWPKTYQKRLPGFVDHVLEYYEMWQDGELDIEELQEDLWEYGGLRLQEGER